MTESPLVQEMVALLTRAVAPEGGFEGREETALRILNEVGRGWLASELARHEVETAQVTVDGIRHRRHERGTGQYHSLWGTVEVARYTYRRIGRRNGPTVVPLELRVGLIEGATPAFAASVAQGHASMPMREYERQLIAAHRVPPSRSTLERLAKRLGFALAAALPTVEPIVRADEVLPANAATMSLGLDRTTIPMAEPIEVDARPRRRRRRAGPHRRQPPAPIRVAYRMAYVGTLAIHDRSGCTIATRRLAAPAHEGPDQLLARLGEEITHVRAQCRLPIAIVQDGAPELWHLMKKVCTTHKLRPAVELIDRFHLDERLAAVAELVASDDVSSAVLRARWRTMLDRSATGIDLIADEIGRLCDHFTRWNHPRPPRAIARWLRGHLRKDGGPHELAQHWGYIDGNRHRMRYASVARRGFPIGSGATEGACKSVITARFKRSGQRWLEPGVDACLTLRTLHLNDRLLPCLHQLTPSYVRDVRLI
jgi:hypothetical protein